jgi:hypothetical protein
MSVGPMTWLDTVLAKIANGTVNLETDVIKVAICTSAQVLSEGFTGASGDGRYADLTAQLPTAAGYTLGGAVAANNTLTRTGNTVKLTTDRIDWTFTSTTNIKYIVFYSDTATNKDIICFADLSQEGGMINVIGLLRVSVPPGGFLDWKTS